MNEAILRRSSCVPRQRRRALLALAVCLFGCGDFSLPNLDLGKTLGCGLAPILRLPALLGATTLWSEEGVVNARWNCAACSGAIARGTKVTIVVEREGERDENGEILRPRGFVLKSGGTASVEVDDQAFARDDCEGTIQNGATLVFKEAGTATLRVLDGDVELDSFVFSVVTPTGLRLRVGAKTVEDEEPREIRMPARDGDLVHVTTETVLLDEQGEALGSRGLIGMSVWSSPTDAIEPTLSLEELAIRSPARLEIVATYGLFARRATLIVGNHESPEIDSEDAGRDLDNDAGADDEDGLKDAG